MPLPHSRVYLYIVLTYCWVWTENTAEGHSGNPCLLGLVEFRTHSHIFNTFRKFKFNWNLSQAHNSFSKSTPDSVTEQMDSALHPGVQPTLAELATLENLTEMG